MLKRYMFLRFVIILVAVAGFAPAALADEIVDGSTGPGSVYRLVRPTNWNGILVLYAHGYVSLEAPVAIPADAQRVISLVVPQGFAVAVSSVSENGWVVKDGAQRAHQLLGLFTSKFGAPARVYVAGASMGGLICHPAGRNLAEPVCRPAACVRGVRGRDAPVRLLAQRPRALRCVLSRRPPVEPD